MPRFFFHIQDGQDRQQDTEGTELPDEQRAKDEAVLASLELIARRQNLTWPDRWIMTVEDEAGATVCVISFTAECRG